MVGMIAFLCRYILLLWFVVFSLKMCVLLFLLWFSLCCTSYATASFMRCSMKTRSVTSSVKMAWPE